MKRVWIFLVVFAVSCGKVSVDNEDPVIAVYRLNGAGSLETLTVGEDLDIELFITDNEDLQEVLVKIENVSNDDLPQSAKLLNLSVFSGIGSGEFSQTITISTDSTDLAARYNILLQVVDANGNADNRMDDFVLLNPGQQPSVDITSFDPPAVDGIVTLSAGDSLTVNGAINDNTGLSGVEVNLSGPENLYAEQPILGEPAPLTFAFDALPKPMVPESVTAGDYTYSVTVTDNDGHMTFYSQAVVIE